MSDQTRLVSLIEVCIGVGLGFAVSFLAWPFVAHAFGYPYSVAHNLGITGIFTVLSIVRGYIVRRFFASGLHKLATILAGRFHASR
jgi:putative Mn2+ efflux pump MntP